MSPQAERERRENEAALWTARLDGGRMTDADRASLATWLEAHPENRWVLSRYRELSAEIESHADESTRPRGRSPRWLGALAGAAAAAILVAFVGIGPQQLATDTAERHTATLDDGSRVDLNARTTLAVKLRRGERRATLKEGEALFTIAPDPDRPFIVDTPAGEIRVTGTVFNVRAGREYGPVEVTVLEGSVRVASRTGSATAQALSPRTQAVLNHNAVLLRTLSPEATHDVVAWREGQIVLGDTPLAEIVDRFAAYHQRTVTVAREARDYRLGGRLSLYDLDAMLALTERVLPVRIIRQPNGDIRIVPARDPAP